MGYFPDNTVDNIFEFLFFHMAKFQSTSFYLAQWRSKDNPTPEPVKKVPRLLDIVRSDDTRQVCKGDSCALYYNCSTKTYENFGSCERNTFCTESRIIHDAYYIRKGSNSSTLDCINHPNQLKSWKT